LVAASTSYGVSPIMMSSRGENPDRDVAACTMSGSGFEWDVSLEVAACSIRSSSPACARIAPSSSPLADVATTSFNPSSFARSKSSRAFGNARSVERYVRAKIAPRRFAIA
jgi:hypothetical protein